MNVRTPLSVIFASLMLTSATVVMINPMPLASAQVPGLTGSNATSGMTNATSGMTNATSGIASVRASGASSVSPISTVRAAVSDEPTQPSAEQLKKLEEQVNETFGGYPRGVARAAAAPAEVMKAPSLNTATIPSTAPPSLDVNGSNISNISNTSSTSTNTSNAVSSSQNMSQQQPSFALPIKLYKSTPVTPVDPRSIVDEPSVANNGPIVFYTGNWYAARSTDFGATWKYVSPFTMSNFCCDQDVVFDKNHGIFLWYRQGIKDSTTGENSFLLGVSKDALTWTFYSIAPTFLNAGWKNQWFDYPQLALSNNKLWITSNMFNKAGGFVRTVISSWNLADLAAGSTANFQYYFETQEFNFTPVQGATGTMYWAVHHSNAQMKLYKWPESSSTISSALVDVPAWTFGFRGAMICTSPDHLNWCARSDSRITGGWVSNGVLGFLWNANQDSAHGFPYPYVNVATFKEAGFVYSSNPKLWSPNFAYMFGFASPNNVAGEFGIIAMYGGGLYYPSIAAGIVDSASGTPVPYQVVTIRSGNHAASTYGDYIRDRPINGVGRIWIGSGYTPQGCSDGSCVEAWFYAFGR